MAKRKPTNKYYFSVEGETEQWYLKWLQDTINNTEKAACKVSIDCPVRKNPLKHAKSLTVCIWHILTAGFAEQNGRNAKLNGRFIFDY